mmetsp:Transcript_10873/g.14143  ORF Transcript_10873/g.14143 Transcript_10873/m.14143 type:complete len:203 (+) Transcript_10873:96-704(+)|eukprot:CAMPEP_0117733750 /NCGR_PEP_ID=MMETSP0947-20121206/251_1 /TAXON_ID=44440 /ORGANISM="Chattonella subsalsa, Strain CCMP2191" /LENGTH=202 /DNA_ID=CAMNT_0005548371 /DNA_START=213 /DNA_END=821 /DNA_ORIENTATION=+
MAAFRCILFLAVVLVSVSAFISSPQKAALPFSKVVRYGASLNMLAEGEKLPMDSAFMTIGESGPEEVSVADIFAGKKVAVCGLPGAFTPTCSETHLPGFIEKFADFKEKGVDTVVCISVNDPFVMKSWGKALDTEGKVTMLADGGAKFTTAGGLEFDTGNFGGLRMKRLSMMVDNGVVTKLNVEDGGAFTDISAAETLLGQL